MKKLLSFFLFISPILGYTQTPQKTGLLFDKAADEKVTLVTKPLGFGKGLPKAISLAEYAPLVANQGSYGTCVGWSSTYYIATIELAQKLKTKNKEVINALSFDPYFTYLSIIGNSDPDSYTTCEMGTYLTDACDFLYENGPKPLRYSKLGCGDDLESFQKRRFSMLKFSDYYRVFDPEDTKEENITSVCQMLAYGHPVICGMITTESLYEVGGNGLFKPTAKEKADPEEYSYGGHALAIIGYDDDRFGGTFEIINSWGAEWGNKGSFYLKYEDYDVFVRSAFAFETELLELPGSSTTYFGNVDYGYGAKQILETGFMEGNFSKGKLVQGLYYNPVVTKKHKKIIRKATKKRDADLIQSLDENGQKRTVGFVLN